MGPLELAPEPVIESHLVNVHSLDHTTTYESSFTYRHGDSYSAIRIRPGEMSFDVDRSTYEMCLSISSGIERLLKYAERELSARRTARAAA